MCCLLTQFQLLVPCFRFLVSIPVAGRRIEKHCCTSPSCIGPCCIMVLLHDCSGCLICSFPSFLGIRLVLLQCSCCCCSCQLFNFLSLLSCCKRPWRVGKVLRVEVAGKNARVLLCHPHQHLKQLCIRSACQVKRPCHTRDSFHINSANSWIKVAHAPLCCWGQCCKQQCIFLACCCKGPCCVGKVLQTGVPHALLCSCCQRCKQ